jgi:alkylhydroperoxidase family enzyme
MPETLLKRVGRNDLPEAYRAGWDHSVSVNGDATLLEVLGNAPHLLDFLLADFYQKLFFGGAVENRYKQLARLRLSLQHGCRSCNRNNVPDTLAAGYSQAHVDALAEFGLAYEDADFTAAEKSVVALADEMVLTNVSGRLTDALYARLSGFFSDAEIAELTIVCGVLGGLNKAAFVLDAVQKEDYCVFAPKIAAE